MRWPSRSRRCDEPLCPLQRPRLPVKLLPPRANSQDRPGLLTGAAVNGASKLLEIVDKVAQPILVWPAMVGSRPTYQPVDRSPLSLSIYRAMGVSILSQPAPVRHSSDVVRLHTLGPLLPTTFDDPQKEIAMGGALFSECNPSGSRPHLSFVYQGLHNLDLQHPDLEIE